MSEPIETHQDCDDCGAKRSLSVYEGHTFCFACRKRNSMTSSNNTEKTPSQRTMIQEGNFIGWDERGITKPTLKKCGVMGGKYMNPTTREVEKCMIFPYRDKSGNLIGQKLRFKDKTFMSLGEVKSGNPMFCQNLCKPKDSKKLVITEGEVDCLSIREHFEKMDIVSIPNGAGSAVKALSENLPFIEKYGEIILCFDSDDAGREAVEAATSILPMEKLFIAQSSQYKDANEALIKGGREALSQLVFQNTSYSPKDVVSGSELWDVLDVEPPECLTYPYPLLQKMTYGLRKNEMVMIGGGSGSGKSTLAAEVAYHLVNEHKQKIGYIALEDSLKKAAERFISLELNKRVHIAMERPNDEYKEAYDKVLGNDSIHFTNTFGSVDVDRMLSTMRYLVKAKGVDFIILDHITILLSGLESMEKGSQHQQISAAMTKLRTFVDDTGVGLVVLSHLNRNDGLNPKRSSDEEGKQPRYIPIQEGGIPTPENLKGSGSLVELADICIMFGRDTINGSDEVNLWVAKNRFEGSTGGVDTLTYDKETGRLKATVSIDGLTDKDDF